MGNSLRDALLRSGVQAPKPAKTQPPRATGSGKRRQPPRADVDIDLARAWALRARSEAAARQRAQAEAERKAREKKARRQRLRELLEDAALDRPDADAVRHYEFHGKIRRVHVTRDQLAALNAGELGVVQSGGRFLLVQRDIARRAADIEPGCVALLVDPDAPPAADDDVPDDLTW